MRGDLGPIGAQRTENLLAERSQFRVAIELDDAVASRVPFILAALARELDLRLGQRAAFEHPAHGEMRAGRYETGVKDAVWPLVLAERRIVALVSAVLGERTIADTPKSRTWLLSCTSRSAIEMLLRLKSALSNDAPHRKKVEAPLNLSAGSSLPGAPRTIILTRLLHLRMEHGIGAFQHLETSVEVLFAGGESLFAGRLGLERTLPVRIEQKAEMIPTTPDTRHAATWPVRDELGIEAEDPGRDRPSNRPSKQLCIIRSRGPRGKQLLSNVRQVASQHLRQVASHHLRQVASQHLRQVASQHIRQVASQYARQRPDCSQ